MDSKKEVFISYSSADSERLKGIEDALKRNNISYFLDKKDIRAGTRFDDNILLALRNCNAIFLLISEHSVRSEWVISEWSAGWALGKLVIPILYKIEKGDVPERLRSLQIIELHEIDEAVNSYNEQFKNGKEVEEELKVLKSEKKNVAPTHGKFKKALLFDIDGTLLSRGENLNKGRGLDIVKIFRKLTEKGYYIGLITGNDYNVQYKNILKPIIDHSLPEAFLCFSDGGSRAFELNDGVFTPIRDYNDDNVMDEHKDFIISKFKAELKDFLEKNPELNRPNIRLFARTLERLDTIISPIRPEFYDSRLFEEFCNDVKALIKQSGIITPFELLSREIRNALVIRGYGSNPEADVILLIDLISKLFYKPKYADMAKPQEDVRGGEVTTQIAFKPFNDNGLRKKFLQNIQSRLRNADDRNSNQVNFAIQLGGRTTIDVQKEGVDKAKAVNFFIEHTGIVAENLTYFGDEFVPNGNDLPVALMEFNRPKSIIHVGSIDQAKAIVEDPILNEKENSHGTEIFSRIKMDGNGPAGTLNYLQFLLEQIKE